MGEIEAFIGPAERRFRNSVRLLGRFSNVLAIIVVPLALSVWLTLASPADTGTALFWGVLISLGLLQVSLFALTTYYSDNLPELHVELQEQREINDTLAEAITDQEELVRWLDASRSLGVFWSTFQGLLTTFPMGSHSDLAIAASVAVKPMLSVAGTLFDFEFDEIWSVAVYRFDPSQDLLIPLWFDRAEHHPSEGEPRSWKPGDGHVGSAFMQERILFTTDAGSEEASPLLKPSVANERPHDSDIYRSFVSAPIALDEPTGTVHRFGVLVLTSNIPGRFDEENQTIVAHAAQVLAHAFNLNRLALGSPTP